MFIVPRFENQIQIFHVKIFCVLLQGPLVVKQEAQLGCDILRHGWSETTRYWKCSQFSKQNSDLNEHAVSL